MTKNNRIVPVFSCQEMRQFDRNAVEKYGISSLILMENAGHNLFEYLEYHCNILPHREQKPQLVICCGRGNNGGDGFVMARRLRIFGYPVEVITTSDPNKYNGDALTNLRILQNIIREPENCWSFDNTTESETRLQKALTSADWIVDALLGTGACGPLRPPYDLFVREINRAKKPVFAVDIPSGLDGDTGQIETEAVRATVTCTLAAYKKGLLQETAQPYIGQLELADIGIPLDLLN